MFVRHGVSLGSSLPSLLLITAVSVGAEATIETAGLVPRTAFSGGASDLAANADGSSRLWATTDRGPNGTVKVHGKKLRTLLEPAFVPTLVLLAIEPAVAANKATQVAVVRSVPLSGRGGAPLSGRPNGVGNDEPILDAASSTPFAGDPNGVDPEGIVQMKDGSFWMAEEYRPSLMHVSPEGRVLVRFVPRGVRLEGADAELRPVLPEAYGLRQDNRGFESLAVSPDGTRLWTLLQSPLDNGKPKQLKKAGNVRLLAFDPAAGEPVAEYVYRLGDPASADYLTKGAAPDDGKLCALAMIDADTLLTIESSDGAMARLYRFDVAEATNTLPGHPATGLADAQLDEIRDLAAAGIRPVKKSLVADLAPLVGRMREDVYGPEGAGGEGPLKLEGLAILGPDRIALINDNDFGVNLPAGARCDTRLWILRLSEPLWR